MIDAVSDCLDFLVFTALCCLYYWTSEMQLRLALLWLWYCCYCYDVVDCPPLLTLEPLACCSMMEGCSVWLTCCCFFDELEAAAAIYRDEVDLYFCVAPAAAECYGS